MCVSLQGFKASSCFSGFRQAKPECSFFPITFRLSSLINGFITRSATLLPTIPTASGACSPKALRALIALCVSLQGLLLSKFPASVPVGLAAKRDGFRATFGWELNKANNGFPGASFERTESVSRQRWDSSWS